MRKIGTAKIGKITPKPNITHPVVRLPLSCGDVVGESVSIYETCIQGQKAFVVVTGEVLQPEIRCHVAAFEKRIKIIEDEISLFKRLICPDLEQPHSKNRAGFPNQGLYCDGLAEIRTQDLRRVKATSFLAPI
ncbi:hypothetical protein FGU65_09325 [Methanoculleus sp. FWC-SCC1]|uniref:Uncharacterized protein n=1 Tax=Methanoculleus frigidifontis TaxID=2584085 RepID=A0ABT8MB21_9EURY|nr:hypothetical protein [Methanoculleus sp. FWC-SCC1]